MAQHSIRYGHVFAHMTGDMVTPDSAEHGDAAERGWVDPSWSSTTFFDSRNDVRPVVSESLGSPDLTDAVRDALSEHAYRDNGDGTFYCECNDHGTRTELETGNSYSYALHFTVKSLSRHGYVEVSWHPETDGGIDISDLLL